MSLKRKRVQLLRSHSKSQNRVKRGHALANLSILIVEDESIVARDVQTMLYRLGYNAFSIASSGMDAIEKVVENQPDVILMDIRLKEDMDGIEAAERIRERFSIPVIYMSALSDEESLRRAKKTELYFFISKPIEEGELQATIQKACSTPRMSANGNR